MPSKYQIISDLSAQTSVSVTSNTRRYLDFLRTAANNYKYTYDEQILIHAQKPEATACAALQCCAMRRGTVVRPRATSQALNGLRMPP